MDINKTGGPAYPTLTGGQVDEGVWRFEGMTLFDFYAGQVLAAGGTVEEACEDAQAMLELRKQYLYTQEPSNVDD